MPNNTPGWFAWTTSAELGEAVLTAREAAGMTQAELAARARVSRKFVFERGNGAWQINSKIFDPEEVSADPEEGSAEVWILENPSGSWSHPIHIHFEEHRILSRNGRPPPLDEIGRKDVVKLNGNEEVRLFMRFRNFKGRYVMHCHNLLHEDHAMMLLWQVQDTGDDVTEP